MFEDRSLKIDLCALALLALAVFLGISLWTYNATDPPSTIVWPASEVVHNACGQRRRTHCSLFVRKPRRRCVLLGRSPSPF